MLARLAAVLTLIPPYLPTQGQPASSHGTVNILIGNNNGLVAVTDSKLSGGPGPLAPGQKLFKLDDHTICTIAGFYRSRGPSLGDTYPADTAIPDLMSRYLADRGPAPNDENLDTKMSRMLDVLRFGLSLVADLTRREGRERGLEPEVPAKLSITLAGYEGSNLSMLRVDLTPQPTKSGYSYEASFSPKTTINNNLVVKTAGIDTHALLMLLDRGSTYSKGSAILARYYSMSEEQRAQMTTTDLRELAIEVEQLTASEYPKVVGGPAQVAVLDGGRVSLFDQPISVGPHLPRTILDVMPRMIRRETPPPDGRIRGWGVVITDSQIACYLTHAEFANVNQKLDHMLIIESHFDHVLFFYDGSPLALFDESNEITNSELLLGGDVDPKSKFVSTLLKRYPGLHLRDNGYKPGYPTQ